MYSPETIRHLNDEATERAAAENLRPVLCELASLQRYEQRNSFPFKHIPQASLDERFPGEYELVESLFVDSSGFGSDSEPALSVRQFILKAKTLTTEHGALYWAIEETGQFQCYVNCYRKVEKPRSRKRRAA